MKIYFYIYKLFHYNNMNKNYFNVLNNYFMHYMFDFKEGNEHILKNLINSIRIDSNQ